MMGDYVYFNKNGKNVPLHRFVFKHYTGSIGKVHIDHEDRNPLNNTISNLRLATPQQNNLNKNLYINNKSGLKCINCANNDWYFDISLCDRRYKKRGYNSKEEALYGLNYLVEKVASQEEKPFLNIEKPTDALSDEVKDKIKEGIDKYIEKIKTTKYRILVIKNDNSYVCEFRNKYTVKFTIFNKQQNFGVYKDVEEAKHVRDFLVDMFNNINEENYDGYEEEIKNKINSDIIRNNIYKIINKKLALTNDN